MGKLKTLTSVFKKSAKAGDELVSIQGKSLDEVGQLMGKSVTTNGKLQIGAGWKLVDESGSVLKTGGQFIDEIPAGAKLLDVNKARAVKGVQGVNTANDFRFPFSSKTSFRMGVFAVIGYTAWELISFVGAISSTLGDVINNFFGLDCPETDVECQKEASDKLVYLGMGIAAVGAISLFNFFKPSKREA
jgi:hypothetical protein